MRRRISQRSFDQLTYFPFAIFLDVDRGVLRSTDFAALLRNRGGPFFQHHLRREHANGIKIDGQFRSLSRLESGADAAFDRSTSIEGLSIIGRVLGVIGKKI